VPANEAGTSFSSGFVVVRAALIWRAATEYQGSLLKFRFPVFGLPLIGPVTCSSRAPLCRTRSSFRITRPHTRCFGQPQGPNLSTKARFWARCASVFFMAHLFRPRWVISGQTVAANNPPLSALVQKRTFAATVGMSAKSGLMHRSKVGEIQRGNSAIGRHDADG
jgi:hypothetical protein